MGRKNPVFLEGSCDLALANSEGVKAQVRGGRQALGNCLISGVDRSIGQSKTKRMVVFVMLCLLCSASHHPLKAPFRVV